MGLTNRGRRAGRNRLVPRLEGMESRQLLSGMPRLAALARMTPIRVAQTRVAPARMATGGMSPVQMMANPPADLPGPVDAANMVGNQGGPPIQAQGEVLPWVAGFPATFVSLPRGRYATATQVLMEGNRDAPWVAHHGTSINLMFTVPDDPSQSIMFKNVIATPSGTLWLNLMPLENSSGQKNGPAGLPTMLAWKVDGGSSTGYFKGASGQGVAVLRYSTLGGHTSLGSLRGSSAVYYSGLIAPNRFALIGVQNRNVIID